MADGYDRFDNEGGGGGSFVMGLLTGTVLGAGLGMLFAPKAGAALRDQLTEQAGNIRNTASDGYRKASEAAGEWSEKGRDIVDKASEKGRDLVDKASEKGRDIVDKAKDAASRGADEAQRYAREAGNIASSAAATASTAASNAAADVRASANGPGPGENATPINSSPVTSGPRRS
jgi:gas vesicle protein